MMSDDANDGSCDVTICDVIDDDVENANVNSLNLTNWLKAVLVAGVVAILGILLLSTHHSMLLILIRENKGPSSARIKMSHTKFDGFPFLPVYAVDSNIW